MKIFRLCQDLGICYIYQSVFGNELIGNKNSLDMI